MLKKIGLVTVGTAATLAAVAPIASATDHGHHDGPKHKGGKVCSFEGGDAGAASEITGGTLAAAVAQAPVAGNNIANIANCSDFLNNNLNDNLSGNQIAIL